MDVIHMPLQILFVTNLVLPETALPYALLALGRLTRAALSSRRQRARESALMPDQRAEKSASPSGSCHTA